jgi:serine/threonine protein kinase
MEGCYSRDFQQWCLFHGSIGQIEGTRIMNCVAVYNLLKSFVLDLSLFEEGAEMTNVQCRSGSKVSTKRYSRWSDGLQIVVKSYAIFGVDKMNEILSELFLLTRLKHCCIAPIGGFVLPTDSTPLKTATVYYSWGSLQDVLDDPPDWWTLTTKSKTIAGIALGMKSAHEHGVVHGSLRPTNILFDDEHCVHIVDFGLKDFERYADDEEEENEEVEEEEEVEDAEKADIFSFACLMFHVLVDRKTCHSVGFDEKENERVNNGEFPKIPEFVPMFVQELIENIWSPDGFKPRSFGYIIEVLKENRFEFGEGVEIGEVLEFVEKVEESCF